MNMTLLVFYFPIQDLAGRGGGGGCIFFSFDLGYLGYQNFCMMLGEVVGRYEKIMAIKKISSAPL